MSQKNYVNLPLRPQTRSTASAAPITTLALRTRPATDQQAAAASSSSAQPPPSNPPARAVNQAEYESGRTQGVYWGKKAFDQGCTASLLKRTWQKYLRQARKPAQPSESWIKGFREGLCAGHVENQTITRKAQERQRQYDIASRRKRKVQLRAGQSGSSSGSS